MTTATETETPMATTATTATTTAEPAAAQPPRAVSGHPARGARNPPGPAARALSALGTFTMGALTIGVLGLIFFAGDLTDLPDNIGLFSVLAMTAGGLAMLGLRRLRL